MAEKTWTIDEYAKGRWRSALDQVDRVTVVNGLECNLGSSVSAANHFPSESSWPATGRGIIQRLSFRVSSTSTMLSRTRALPSLSRALRSAIRAQSTQSASASNTTDEPKLDVPAAPQAPNYASTWSTNQRQRPVGVSGPRFEQAVMELQPQPLSAMEMINNEPIRYVEGRKAVCEGGMALPPQLHHS